MELKLNAGGTLGQGMLYVERAADRELPEALLEAKFCYVLAPRQSGKSSLRARTERQLAQRGVKCANIDLTHIGVRVTIEEWYVGLVELMAEQLGLADPGAFWEEHKKLSPVQRWLRYLRHEVLGRIDAPIVVFIDEIDTVLALDLPRDDFFAAIRAIYNLRADDKNYERITFCLLGVASPGDLIQDPKRTPFNIGSGIRLEDFTQEEAAAFLPALALCGDDAQALLDAVLRWTEGHPYMTHRLCEALVKEGPSQQAANARVEAAVRRLFIERWADETSLAVIDGYFQPSGRTDSARIGAMLKLYDRLLDEGPIAADRADPTQMALRLTGLAAERNVDGVTMLKRRSPILAAVFNREWVRSRLGSRHDGPEALRTESITLGMRIGSYRVTRRIGGGSQGAVFEAKDENLNRIVAIKVLHAATREDPALSQRFINEARAASAIMHPGIVQVLGFGQLPAGLSYFVMEYLSGHELTHFRDTERLSADEACELVRQIAQAMVAAHERGIVHRELTPTNIMVVADAQRPFGRGIKILGFGVAMIKDSPAESSVAFGTPLYIAPERFSDGPSDDKTDVYSLGVMFYELLAGKPPFVSKSAHDLLAKKIYGNPPALPPGTAKELEQLVRAMLAVQPKARPSMQEVAQTLTKLGAQEAMAADSRLQARRRRLFFATSLFGGLVGVLTGLGFALDLPATIRAYFNRPAVEKMTLIEGGNFRMGSTDDEVATLIQTCRSAQGADCQPERFERELPIHEVTLSSFYIDKYEVTNEEFAAWLNRTSGRLRVDPDGKVWNDQGVFLNSLFSSGLQGPILHSGNGFSVLTEAKQLPVTQVSLNGAWFYCRSLGKRLPTEAEWEYTASAHGTVYFPWGSAPPTCEGTVFDRDAGGRCAQLKARPVAVGTAAQDVTPDGVHDLAGNAAEWVMDSFRVPYPACSAPCKNPVVKFEPQLADFFVVRGGDFGVNESFCRAKSRSRLLGTSSAANVGFRCATEAR